MSILQNAINSIVIGIEDYNLDDEKRLLSSTRNLFAGVLLLFKHKLVELSPTGSDEVLIKQKVLPKLVDETLIWIGSGKKTVDVEEIKNRFKALSISVDWKKIDKINKYRNNIEHYYSTESKEAVKTLIANSFIVIRDFITEHLNEDPKGLLGISTWETMLKISEVYEAEKRDCLNRLEGLEWKSVSTFNAIADYRCETCHSDLITLNDEDEIVCKTCGKEYEQNSLTLKSLLDAYGYYRMQDGEEPDLYVCPFCNQKACLTFEDECQLCGESIPSTCVRCGSEITPNNYDDSELCDYCRYVYEKMNEDD